MNAAINIRRHNFVWATESNVGRMKNVINDESSLCNAYTQHLPAMDTCIPSVRIAYTHT